MPYPLNTLPLRRLAEEALHHALVTRGTCPGCGRALDLRGLCHGPPCRDEDGQDLGCACDGCRRARVERVEVVP